MASFDVEFAALDSYGKPSNVCTTPFKVAGLSALYPVVHGAVRVMNDAHPEKRIVCEFWDGSCFFRLECVKDPAFLETRLRVPEFEADRGNPFGEDEDEREGGAA